MKNRTTILEEHIELFCEGDSQAIIPIYNLLVSELYFVAYKYVRNQQDAEDVVADVFEKLLIIPRHRIKKKVIDDGVDFKAFLITVVVHKAIDKFRVQNNRRQILSNIQFFSKKSTHNKVWNQLAEDFFKTAISTLPEKEN